MSLRFVFNQLVWIFLLLGAASVAASLLSYQIWGNALFIFFGGLSLLLGFLLGWWYIRPNTAKINPALAIETWDVVKDSMHNSNTDMIRWGEYFYLVHAVSPYHFASTGCHLVLLRSRDGHVWERLAEFNAPQEDIRDPKLAVINGKMLLYVLVNRSFDPEPYATGLFSSKDNGCTWSALTMLEHEGWLFWKPKTMDGVTWYAAAYWHAHGKAALFSTTDGTAWKLVSMIHDGGMRNDETDIEFLPDKSLLSVARLEGDFKEWGYNMFFGDSRGGSLITTAASPYAEFSRLTISSLTRLDGPALFAWEGRVFAVGRFQPALSQPFTRQGSIFARKRTAIFEVTTTGLIWLSDVPSAGDTAYAGVALHEGCLYFSYYTSPVHKDYPWIVGMFNPTHIRMAKVELSRLGQPE